MKRKKYTYYIDCTDIIKSNANTGIQRVERNLINNRFSAQQKLDAIFQPVFFEKHFGFIKVAGCTTADLVQSIGYLYNIRLCLFQFWRFKRLIIATFPLANIQNWLDHHWHGTARWLLMWPFFIFMAPIIIVSLIYTAFVPIKNIWNPNKNDILIIPGLSWCHPNLDIQKGIANIKKTGGRITTLIHDLIPITHSQYCANSFREDFKNHLPFIVNNTDLFIANSKTTEKSLNQYLQTNKLSRNPAISYFYLGTELDLIKDTLPVRKDLKTIFTTQKTYICIGTIEPRKNHRLLLDAFDTIWKENLEIHLCIIGRYGCKSEKLVERIKNHPLFGDNLTWFKDINDTELSYCYNNAKALIFPSITEGFGLPLIEALHYGCPVMASDISVFREIGADRCAYFSIDTPDNLVSLINEFEETGKLSGVRQSDDFQLISWEESALEFYTLIARHFEKI